MSPARRRLVLAGALVLALGVWLTGIDESFLYGHSGWCAARRAVAGVNFVRHGFEETGYGPVENLAPVEPDEFDVYWHHPVGIHLLVGASFRALGVGEWQARVVPVLLMLASFLLFYLMAREWWRGPGLAAALVFFSTIPMLGYYGPFVNQEPLVLVFCMAAAWLQTRWSRHPHAWVLACTAVVAFLAAWSDWPWFVFAFALASVELLRLMVRRSPDVRWVVVFGVGVTAGLFGVIRHLVALQDAKDWLDGFLHLFEFRSGGEKKTLDDLLERAGDRWVQLFTPTLITAGLVWLPVTLWDAVRGRLTMKHAVAWSFLFTGALWSWIFKQGASIHEFWPFYAAPFFVIAGADLVERLAGMLGRLHRGHLRHAGLAVAAALIALQATSGLAGVVHRHRNPDPNLWEADDWRLRHTLLGAWIAEHTEPDADVALMRPIDKARFQLGFYQRREWRRLRVGEGTRRLRAPRGTELAVVDLRVAPQQVQRPLLEDMVRRFPVTILEGFAIADLRRPGDAPTADLRRPGEAPEVTWLRREEREPGLAHGWLESMVYGPGALVRDPHMEAMLLLTAGRRDLAVQRYLRAGPPPDDLQHRVADHVLARAAGLEPPDPAPWLADMAPLPEGLDGPVAFGDALELVGLRAVPPTRRGLVLEAVFRVTEAPGEGWRAFLDRYAHDVCEPEERRKAVTRLRFFPGSGAWRAGDLIYLRGWVPRHPWQERLSVQLGFWRPSKNGPNEHLRVGGDRGLTVRPLGLEEPTPWPWWLDWLDLRWPDRDCD